MNQAVVYFSHGMESSPHGTKIRNLSAIAEKYDFSYKAIDYTDTYDPDLRAERLIRTCRVDERDKIFVGSSMGAYVSLAASEHINVMGLFLMAPAIYMPGYKKQDFNIKSDLITIIHGFRDEVIPFDHSVKFSEESLCDLHLINSDHRLNDRLTDIEHLFKNFLAKIRDSIQ